MSDVAALDDDHPASREDQTREVGAWVWAAWGSSELRVGMQHCLWPTGGHDG